MAFAEETLEEAFERSGGRCECNRGSCGNHYLSRCPTRLSKATAVYNRIKATGFGDLDRLDNCEVICQTCFANSGYDEFAKFGASVR